MDNFLKSEQRSTSWRERDETQFSLKVTLHGQGLCCNLYSHDAFNSKGGVLQQTPITSHEDENDWGGGGGQRPNL